VADVPDGYTLVRSDELERLRAIDAKHGWRDRPPPDSRHRFVPDKKYPWFCGQCGYAPHEPLMHYQEARP